MDCIYIHCRLIYLALPSIGLKLLKGYLLYSVPLLVLIHQFDTINKWSICSSWRWRKVMNVLGEPITMLLSKLLRYSFFIKSLDFSPNPCPPALHVLLTALSTCPPYSTHCIVLLPSRWSWKTWWRRTPTVSSWCILGSWSLSLTTADCSERWREGLSPGTVYLFPN